ncbi:sensor histidine kinase [Stutzerimonas stutzeri]|uniref:histidine kinase n=1 Tax=Stutzerimonas stutzeri TaxID=316 RepID=A0A6I6LPH8_STUST|nr:sensor histidine kinase [Stutzerimonas stutzeri]QGZ30395.1 HAMP domain-containing protein [Stutzerimonas stutzeri]
MPNRHSLFWRLVVLVAGFCLAMIWVSGYVGQKVAYHSSFLSPHALKTLEGYAERAYNAALNGPAAVDRWITALQQDEPGLALVVDRHHQSLGGRELNERERGLLRFARPYDSPMSRRAGPHPMIAIPFNESGDQLVMQLPERLSPWHNHALLVAATVYLPPVVLSVLFGWLLYRLLISPLDHLRRQANTVRGNRLSSLLPLALTRRNDELGELGRSLEYLTRRLHDSIRQQQQLLRDLSHELRTPLSRLRVACESDLPQAILRERVEREVTGMQRLVDGTLELAWLDSEQPQLAREAVDVESLWNLICEDACFESGWPRTRLHSDIPKDCQVFGNLNALAQAMENVLRNAIRHSPADGTVRLTARREDAHWRLSIDDQGPGVRPDQLDMMFRPFSRLSASRPGGDGFGLGLAIARGMMVLQGGRIWAENLHPGLRVNFVLQDV